VPDWPTSEGFWWLPMHKMVGGVKFEHGHRMIAELVGLLTIIAAIWTWKVDRRRWMRFLSIGAVLGVIFQGILGGLTVLEFTPPLISTAHATVGQTMFCCLAVIAVFTSKSWLEDPSQTISQKEAAPLIRHAWMLMGFLYLQLILGAAFRHVWTKWGPNAANRWPAHKIIHMFLYPHILNALLVAGLILYLSMRTLSKHANILLLKRPAVWMLLLLILQLLLGASAYMVRVVQGIDEVQPTLGLVTVTVAHLAVGALILALAMIFTVQAYRHRERVIEAVPISHQQEVAKA
jgi:heme a synthase